MYYFAVTPTPVSRYTREFATSTGHITRMLIVRHMQVNPSLHARICYLACDLYCTSADSTDLKVNFWTLDT